MPRIWTDEECYPFATPARPATVLYIVDGDTFDVTIDIGFDTRRVVRVRLIGEEYGLKNTKLGVNAWESRGSEKVKGLAAKARVKEIMPAGSEVRVISRKGGTKGSLSRWLLCVLVNYHGGWVSIGDLLIEEGHARAWWAGWKSGKPQPK